MRPKKNWHAGPAIRKPPIRTGTFPPRTCSKNGYCASSPLASCASTMAPSTRQFHRDRRHSAVRLQLAKRLAPPGRGYQRDAAGRKHESGRKSGSRDRVWLGAAENGEARGVTQVLQRHRRSSLRLSIALTGKRHSTPRWKPPGRPDADRPTSSPPNATNCARYVDDVIQRAIPILAFLERIIYPRLAIPPQATKRVVGTTIFVLTVRLLLMPLPLSNVLPAILIAFISLTYLEHDGVLLIIALFGACGFLVLEFGAISHLVFTIQNG